MKKRERKIIEAFGRRGYRRVIVVRQRGRYVVERYIDGLPRRRGFGRDKEAALVWAEEWYRAGSARSYENLTLRVLFDRYIEVTAVKKKWRAKTMVNVQQHRKRIEEVLGPEAFVNGFTFAHLDELWVKLTGAGMAPNQVRAKVKLLQRAMAFGHAREYVAHNKLETWEIPEVKALKIAEFRAAETEQLLRTFDYQRSGWDWRPWGLILLMASHGFRVRAALHLRWADVDLDRAVIRLRAEVDKTNRNWERPMTWEALAVFLTARYHRDRLRKRSPFVFYGKDGKEDQPYTYQAFNLALKAAEAEAGIEHVRYRGAHGFRRQAIGDVRAATGDPALALLWVGKTDLRAATDYVKERADELLALAARKGLES